MRKSTWIMIAILFATLCAMMFAANAMISPLKKDIELSGLLTRYFTDRRDLRSGTRVIALRAKGGTEKRLAKEGSGIVVEATPADAVLAEPEGLGNLARALARKALAETTSTVTQWVEVQFRVGPSDGASPAPPDAAPLRTLVAVDDVGALGSPTPPLPATLAVPGRDGRGVPATPTPR
jgi:hypothetical protein